MGFLLIKEFILFQQLIPLRNNLKTIKITKYVENKIIKALVLIFKI
jgi:hypothetical protein